MSASPNFRPKVFTHRKNANLSGYFTSGQLRRQFRKPVGEPAAILVTETEAVPLRNQRFYRLGDWLWLNEHTVIRDHIPLYPRQQTKPYRPSKKTQGVWRFQDLFVGQTKKFSQEEHGKWRTVEVHDWRKGLTEQKINQHVSLKTVLGTWADRYTNFVALDVDLTSAGTGQEQHLDLVEVLLSKADRFNERLSARKWFVQVADLFAEGIHLFWILDGRNKTERIRSCMRQWLKELAQERPGLQKGLRQAGLKTIDQLEIYPDPLHNFRLPLARDRTCLLDRPLSLVQGKKKNGVPQLESDVWGLVSWIDDPKSENMAVCEIFDYYQQRLLPQGVTGNRQKSLRNRPKPVGEDLLFIAVENEDEDLDSWKNQWWRRLTDYWKGTFDPPNHLNKMLAVTARLFFFEDLSQDEAEQRLLDFCDQKPSPTSRRLLDPGQRSILISDIRRIVRTIYGDNGGQQDRDQSTDKLQISVHCWHEKGLWLSDPQTWDMTYGYAAVPDFEFTEKQRSNISAYLGPLLSSRDVKRRSRDQVAVEMAKAAVKLVGAKEREGGEISTGYFQQYLKGETGVSCRDKRKWGRLKRAMIDLRLFKVLKQGAKHCGATKYGLTGEMLELLGLDRQEQRALEWKIPENLDEQLERLCSGNPYEEFGVSEPGIAVAW